MQAGISMAAVAMSHGIPANLLRRWIRQAELVPGSVRPDALVATGSSPVAVTPCFVPVQLPVKSALPNIRIELRRGATSIAVTWPTDAAGECAAWMLELLR
jgi:transposase-like protein